VTSAVCDCTATVGLATLAEFRGLTTESSLVDFAICSSAKWHTVAFKLTHGNRSLSSHVMYGILITEPVTALDSVIKVVFPTVLVHVSQSCVDSTLID